MAVWLCTQAYVSDALSCRTNWLITLHDSRRCCWARSGLEVFLLEHVLLFTTDDFTICPYQKLCVLTKTYLEMHSSHTASSTIRLSNELWIVVLELVIWLQISWFQVATNAWQLYEDGCHHLLAVSRTCSWLDQLAKPLIFGNIVIDRNAWTEYRYESLLKRHINLAKHTSSIEVRKGADSNDFVPVSEKYLPEIVRICSRLQDFT